MQIIHDDKTEHKHEFTEHEKKVIQAELDMAEIYIMECLFGSSELKHMHINSKIKAMMTFCGKNLQDELNCKIKKFEALMWPCMLPNGMVDVERVVETIGHFYGHELHVPVKEMRLVDFFRRFDKLLHHLGRHIQGLEHVPHHGNPY